MYVHDNNLEELNIMKKLLTITLLSTLLVTASYGAVVCEKKGRFYYPKNAVSKEIALSLGVKTCNGGRFKEVVKGLGEKSNVPATKKKMSVAELIKKMKK